MATLHANNYKAAYITHPPAKLPAGAYGSTVCAVVDAYDITGAEQIGDVVLWAKLPQGATILDMSLTHTGIDCADISLGVQVYPAALGSFVAGGVNESFRAASNMGLQFPERFASTDEEEAYALCVYFGAVPLSLGQLKMTCTYTVY